MTRASQALPQGHPSEAMCDSMLVAGNLPVEALAILAVREARRPRAIYQAHKWFARRYGSAFRALLVAARTPPQDDFWDAFYHGVDLSETRLLDSFLGGGTSLIEAFKMGGDVTGVDVDPVACAITRFEATAIELPDLAPHLARLNADVARRLKDFYVTRADGVEKTVVHYFWVQAVVCGTCGAPGEAHPDHRLAQTAANQWIFCPKCHEIDVVEANAAAVVCATCGHRHNPLTGVVRRGAYACSQCGTEERLIDIARRDGRPIWSLFAMEVIDEATRRSVPIAKRRFLRATEEDRKTYERASHTLRERLKQKPEWLPSDRVSDHGRIDSRLVDYGYRYYRDLFNDRQLLHLSLLAEAVAHADAIVRPALAMAFSDHLTTNCMMTSYAKGWRRLVPLFAVRAFRHVTRPVELNPWLSGTGRGTYPNAVRQVARAARDLREPRELQLAGGFRQTELRAGKATVVQGDSRDLSFISDGTISLVLTDPPYYDNIAYSELSAFYLPWLKLVDKTIQSADEFSPVVALGRGRDAAADFAEQLGRSFREVERTLAPNGRVIFTYKHTTVAGWWALATALAASSLRVLQVLPILGDGTVTLHARKNTITWDSVLVLGHGRDANEPGLCACNRQGAEALYHGWRMRLQSCVPAFRPADANNLRRACLVGASLGMFPDTCRGARVDLWNPLSGEE
jgi:putative DNA methylase